ncbi:unnamed protein product [Tilletia controversa]|nr:unnamed protein product [Tilletia controversa]CAD6986327.1 unnamed protein product [Tilletia controversa]
MNSFTPPSSPPLEPVPDEVHPPMPILPTPHAYAVTEAAYGIVKLHQYNKSTDTFRGTWARGPVRASDVNDHNFAKTSKMRSQAKAGSSTRRRST